jgi:FAD synthase
MYIYFHMGSLEVIVFIPPLPQYNQVRHGNVVNWQKLQRTGELPTVNTTPALGTRLGKIMTDISITRHRGVISLGIPFLKNKKSDTRYNM